VKKGQSVQSVALPVNMLALKRVLILAELLGNHLYGVCGKHWCSIGDISR
jgi:hypothetical protein